MYYCYYLCLEIVARYAQAYIDVRVLFLVGSMTYKICVLLDMAHNA